MSGVLRGIITARSALAVRGPTISQRAGLVTRPAKAPVNAGGICAVNMMLNWGSRYVPKETMIGIGLFSLAILGPMGWILSNLESYKSKD